MISRFSFEELLPPYLISAEKGRIKTALRQFFNEGTEPLYDGFYTFKKQPYLMQADVLHSVKGINFDFDRGEYETGYNAAMLISNSCDVSTENNRAVNQKEALFAPIVPVNAYLEDFEEQGFSHDQLNNFYNTLKRQEYTNLFYMPPVNDVDYMVRLDRTYWVPQSEIAEALSDLDGSRFISLSNWGYYLFITKLSLHLCRVPEEFERPIDDQN